MTKNLSYHRLYAGGAEFLASAQSLFFFAHGEAVRLDFGEHLSS
jgi:hypothetical protein